MNDERRWCYVCQAEVHDPVAWVDFNDDRMWFCVAHNKGLRITNYQDGREVLSWEAEPLRRSQMLVTP